MAVSRGMHNKLLECVMNAPMTYHEKTPLGKILKHFTRDIDNVDKGFFDTF